LQNQLADSITHATIEPCDEGSGVRVIACGKEPEPVGGKLIKIQKKTLPGRSSNQMLLSEAKSPYPEA
jgi:hypothetical protein